VERPVAIGFTAYQTWWFPTWCRRRVCWVPSHSPRLSVNPPFRT